MLRFDGERGFSLLELIMVIVVIALVLAVTYPSLSKGNATLHLRTAAREVINTVRYAREKAITEQTEMRIVADRENRRFALTDGYGEGARHYNLPHDVAIGRIALRGQEILDGPLVIRFLPNGSAEPAELQLVSERGGTVRLVTDPVTGTARVAPGGER